jgi:EAL domain-containing protein (putative c-di-GMP-specific phosphodiesterase class I)
MIEVTEDAFVAKSHFQDEILPIFRKLGVGISIDDFGIGYSSLSALADITADEIKIDRSFITDIHKRPRSQGILRAIESLSEALGMTVIAEGIESFEELAYLQAATKIRYAQGFYFSRPIFLEELKPATPLFSEARVSLASRPPQENRPAYGRGDRYRR